MEKKKDELYQTIRPLLQQKIEKLLTDSVEKLLGTLQKQDSKMTKITDVLRQISEAKDVVSGAYASPPAHHASSFGSEIDKLAAPRIKKANSQKTLIDPKGGFLIAKSNTMIGNPTIPEVDEGPSPAFNRE